jgi:hypothetical protein
VSPHSPADSQILIVGMTYLQDASNSSCSLNIGISHRDGCGTGTPANLLLL